MEEKEKIAYEKAQRLFKEKFEGIPENMKIHSMDILKDITLGNKIFSLADLLIKKKVITKEELDKAEKEHSKKMFEGLEFLDKLDKGC